MGREKWVVLAAFLGGILLANLLDEQLLVSYGVLNDYFLSRYASFHVDQSELFCSVLLERCKAALFIFLLGRAVPRGALPTLLESAVAAGVGFLAVVAVYNLGMSGIVICLGGLLPQWLFYLAALAVYLDARRQTVRGSARWELSAHLLRGCLTLLLLALGILAESFLGPALLRYVLKFF